MDGVCPQAAICVPVRSFFALLVPKYKYWQRDIAWIYAMRRVLRQYLYFCTSKASKPRAARTCVSNPCTRFTSTQVQILTLSTCGTAHAPCAASRQYVCQYLHFRTSKASKLGTYGMRRVPRAASARAAILGVIPYGAGGGSKSSLLR